MTYRKGEMDMKRKCLCFCAASLLAMSTLCAADGDLLATDTSAEFDVYATEYPLYSAKSYVEVSALPSVAYRAGETVTIKSPSGATSTLVVAPSTDGTVRLASSDIPSGGVYTIVNSAQGEAKIGASWSMGGGGTLASVLSGAYVVDSVAEGPNRTTSRIAAPPVSYVGDDWRDGVARGGTLTFLAPSGQSTQRTGSVAEPFAFRESGVWTVTLVPLVGATCSAEITVVNGFVFAVF